MPRACGALTRAPLLPRRLNVDERAAAALLAQFKRTAYNDAQALTRASEEGTASSAALQKAALGAELSLLRYAHEQRCLLLRCVHQLLAVAYDADAELHAVACGEVALLLQARATQLNLAPLN